MAGCVAFFSTIEGVFPACRIVKRTRSIGPEEACRGTAAQICDCTLMKTGLAADYLMQRGIDSHRGARHTRRHRGHS